MIVSLIVCDIDLLRNEGIGACYGERQTQKFPVGLLHRLERVVRDLHAGWRIGTARDTRHVNLALRNLVRILEDWLILRVPMGNGTLHVAVTSNI